MRFNDDTKVSLSLRSAGRTQIVGSNEAILRAQERIIQAQGLRILLVGETGVGKTPFARFSNEVVSEATGTDRPFEQINCACLSSEHFQDQLFGHKRGAFTGAIADKRGLVEIARGGDLFLDEIGDMPLETQAHFLTFLDTMEYYPLGEDKKRRAEVRVICATNRDLRAMSEQGTFRRDLYSRISQVVVEIPALRDRPEDIAPLFRHFVQYFGVGPKPYDEAIVTLFEDYSWKEGNVRELRDAVEYLCLMSASSERIRVEHVGDRFRNETSQTASGNYQPKLEDVWFVSKFGLENYLERIEKSLLEKCLTRNLGSLESMARQLRISRPTLYRRLKKYAILGARELESRTIGAF